MSLYRLADGFSSADVQGMSLDPQSQDPADGYQNPRDLVAEPASDGQDPATPGGPAPYNGAEPLGQPVTTDPMWKSPDEPKKPPYSPTPYTGPGPNVDVTTLHNARRTPMEETMTADLWVLASQDAEQELNEERLVRAKVAAAGIWPFLAEAKSEREFGHRVALVETELEELFPDTGFRDQVTASLRDDYLLLTGAVIEEHGTATLTSEAASAVQDGGATAREALLATNEQLAAAPSLFDHLAVGPEGVDAETETNPAFFDSGPEMGPATGNSQGFAQAAPDPFNPMNAQYPMVPSEWTVPPGKDWVERPMEFGKQGARWVVADAHPDHATHYRGEGVETGAAGSKNPLYFSAPEGVTNGQDGFAPDVSLPEPDERADWYGSVPPQTGQPAAPTPSYSNTHSGARMTAEKDNHGACAHCNAPVYRNGDVWQHLTGDPGHGVRLHEDHPWVRAQQANRVMAVRHTAPGGGEHAPYEIREVDGGYAVFNAKGERKNEEPKTEEEARQFQKALYSQVPGARESAERSHKNGSVGTMSEWRTEPSGARSPAAKSAHWTTGSAGPVGRNNPTAMTGVPSAPAGSRKNSSTGFALASTRDAFGGAWSATGPTSAIGTTGRSTESLPRTTTGSTPSRTVAVPSADGARIFSASTMTTSPASYEASSATPTTSPSGRSATVTSTSSARWTTSSAPSGSEALYKNVPGASESAEKAASRKVARWVLAEASSSDTGTGMTDAASVDPMGAPPTPQSMEPGGAGSVAGPPLTIPNDSVSTHPFAGQNPGQTAPTAPGMGLGMMASRYVVADTMNRPTAENPLGVDSGDEFDLNNWEAPAQQRPRQDADSRHINTPQRPRQPIPVRSSDGGPGAEEDEEEGR